MPALQWSLGMTIHCKWSSLLDCNSRAVPQGFTWIVASAVYFFFAHFSLLALASYHCPFFPVPYLLFVCLLPQQKTITCSSSIWSAIELHRQGNSWDVMGYFPCLNAYIWVIAVVVVVVGPLVMIILPLSLLRWSVEGARSKFAQNDNNEPTNHSNWWRSFHSHLNVIASSLKCLEHKLISLGFVNVGFIGVIEERPQSFIVLLKT